MINVKRFDCYDSMFEEENDSGKYVYYTDYERLEKENEGLKQQIEDLKLDIKRTMIINVNLSEENAKFKAQLDIFIENQKELKHK